MDVAALLDALEHTDSDVEILVRVESELHPLIGVHNGVDLILIADHTEVRS